MARPPDEEKPRDVRIILRVLPEERAAWRREAKRVGVSLSAWLRTLANRAAKRGRR